MSCATPSHQPSRIASMIDHAVQACAYRLCIAMRRQSRTCLCSAGTKSSHPKRSEYQACMSSTKTLYPSREMPNPKYNYRRHLSRTDSRNSFGQDGQHSRPSVAVKQTTAAVVDGAQSTVDVTASCHQCFAALHPLHPDSPVN